MNEPAWTRPSDILAALRWAADYAGKRHNPSAHNDLFWLRDAGYVLARHAGWGHYEVDITAAGQRLLEKDHE